jgi:UDP-N-acetylglucosamine acyltransferase
VAVHPSAIVDPGARLGVGVAVGPGAVVEDDVTIGDRTEIRAHAVVKRYTSLGVANQVHEGAVLGGEPQDLAFGGGETRLVIGDGNRIREHATIHRASKPGGVTVVGSECFLMAGAHVAHDCRIGDRAIIANNTLIAGHVEVGERAFVSGGVVVHQFARIGKLAMVGGGSAVRVDCLPFVISDGHPARARSLNVVGLRRAGLTASQVRPLKEAYHLLLLRGLPLEDALAQMSALQDPLVEEMVAFVRGSKRGFARAGRDAED